MTLAIKLTEIRDMMAAQLPPEILNTLGNSLAELVNDNIAQYALGLGDLAPDFTLPATNNNNITLYQLLQDKPVILSFFRGNWCPFCVAELEYYQTFLPEQSTVDAHFIAISPQIIAQNQQLQSTKVPDLTLLSDFNNNIARKYGLVFSLQENIRELYKNIGADLPVFNGNNTFELPIPATYLIGQDKIIRYAFVNANYMKRAEPDDIKRALQVI